MTRVALEHLILRFADRLEAPDSIWAVTGSAAHRLLGMDTPVRDFDVIADHATAYAIAGRLRATVVRPVGFETADRIRSHFGVLALDGWIVEVMGAVEFRASDGTWELPVDIEARRVFVAVGARSIPVMSLEHEIHMYERLLRLDKAAALRRFRGVC